MAVYKLAVIIKSPSDDEFLLVRQIPPPKLPEEEYQNYVDSDLWDLPSAPLVPNENESSRNMVEGAESCAHQLNLQKFDVSSALDQVLSQVGLGKSSGRPWVFWKYVEEAEFGPEPLVHMVFILGKLKPEEAILQEVSKWLSIQSAGNLLFKVKPRNDRIGPLVVIGFGPDLAISTQLQAPHSLRFQEYPPGVIVVPMRSRTLKPFRTTNLVLIAPDNVTDSSRDSCSVAYGDALLMDPGCHSNFHAELMEIVTALPRKLVVFVTHHHPDHVEGLSVIQKCNPDATLLAHENTMRRIGKDLWSLGYTRISGGEEVCIGGQQLNVVSAPGHTDGHMALLHVGTHSLIVGDHCVGHGSAVLDIGSGGNMMDYFQTTYNFLELAPHALIPMHGRINLWPMRMLCGYLKHRRDRESSILAAIESGAVTLFDVIAKSYPDLDSSLMWLASFNVRLHVDHLASQGMLPKEFSMERFQASFGFHFVSRWIWRCLKERVTIKAQGLGAVELFTAIAVAGFAMFLHYQIQTESISNS